MSRHAQLFDRVAVETGAYRSPQKTPTEQRRRGPALSMHESVRTEVEKVVNLIRRHGQAMPKVIVFADVDHANGRRSICAHTADLLAAGTEGAVCLVDANLRSPLLHLRFGVPNRQGLADLIRDPSLSARKVASQVDGRDFWLLTGGPGTYDRNSCVAQSDAMRSRIAELRSSFDYVLIEAPPISMSNDGLALGQLADGVLLIVHAGSTPRNYARKRIAELAASGVKFVGAILDDYTSPVPSMFRRWL